MKNLKIIPIIFACLILLNCKKKNDSPAESSTATTVIKNYSFSITNNGVFNKSPNTNDIVDSLIYFLKINNSVMASYKAVATSTPGYWRDVSTKQQMSYTLTPKVSLKSGDVVTWSYNYYTLMSDTTYVGNAIYNIKEAWINEVGTNTKTSLFTMCTASSCQHDTIKLISGERNIYISTVPGPNKTYLAKKDYVFKIP